MNPSDHFTVISLSDAYDFIAQGGFGETRVHAMLHNGDRRHVASLETLGKIDYSFLFICKAEDDARREKRQERIESRRRERTENA